MSKISLLEELSHWPLEARRDAAQYFLKTEDFRRLEGGKAFLAIGRKGSGKTALCRNLEDTRAPRAMTQSFKNFPLGLLYSSHDSLFPRHSRYITIWRYVIARTVLKMMQKADKRASAKIVSSPGVRQFLEAVDPLDENLGRVLTRLFERRVAISAAGVVTLEIGDKAEKPQDISGNVAEFTDRIFELIAEHGGSTSYHVLFDELDEDYQPDMTPEEAERYFALLKSLIKAASHVADDFARRKTHILPVIFLRSDIYERITDNDRGKLADGMIQLAWSDKALEEMLKHRLKGVVGGDVQEVDPDTLYPETFVTKSIGIGTGQKRRISIYQYILRQTLKRPRDVISFVRSAATHAHSLGFPKIGTASLRAAQEDYSRYFLQEFIDELGPRIPSCRERFGVLASLGKTNFSHKEFASAYSEAEDAGKLGNVKIGAESFLEHLFAASALGNEPAPGKRVFAYEAPDSALNLRAPICLHRGLFRALEVRSDG